MYVHAAPKAQIETVGYFIRHVMAECVGFEHPDQLKTQFSLIDQKTRYSIDQNSGSERYYHSLKAPLRYPLLINFQTGGKGVEADPDAAILLNHLRHYLQPMIHEDHSHPPIGLLFKQVESGQPNYSIKISPSVGDLYRGLCEHYPDLMNKCRAEANKHIPKYVVQGDFQSEIEKAARYIKDDLPPGR